MLSLSLYFRIASFYENVVPEMYKHIERLGKKDEKEMPVHNELKFKIDIARAEFIKAFRLILSSSINFLVENRYVVLY